MFFNVENIFNIVVIFISKSFSENLVIQGI